MIRVWREIADPRKHRDFMSNRVEGGIPISKARDNLIEKWVYHALVDGFVFQFADMDQVRECKAYFDLKIHPSTMESEHNPHEHFWHYWYCKLPKGRTKKKGRKRILKALDVLLKQWG